MKLFKAFSLTHIFEDSVVVLKWFSVILGSGKELFIISLPYFSLEPKCPYWPQQVHTRGLAEILFCLLNE